MKAIERVYKYLEYKGLKPAAFERRVGISNGYLSKQHKRLADIGESILILILENCPEINAEWLLTGRGNMLKSGNEMGVDPSVISDKDEIITLLKEKIQRLEMDLVRIKKVTTDVGDARITNAG